MAKALFQKPGEKKMQIGGLAEYYICHPNTQIWQRHGYVLVDMHRMCMTGSTHGGSNEVSEVFKNKIIVFGPQVGWDSIA